MKTAIVVATMLAVSTASGWAVTLPAGNANAGLYTCNGRSLSRVAFSAQPEQVAPCCTGMTGCPQLLANTGLVKPRRDSRT